MPEVLGWLRLTDTDNTALIGDDETSTIEGAKVFAPVKVSLPGSAYWDDDGKPDPDAVRHTRR